MAVVPLQKTDRSPPGRLKAVVDALRLHLDLHHESGIAIDLRAARSAHLNEGKLPAIAGELFQEALDPAEALQDSLGVVDAVNPDAEEHRFNVQFLEQTRAFNVRVWSLSR